MILYCKNLGITSQSVLPLAMMEWIIVSSRLSLWSWNPRRVCLQSKFRYTNSAEKSNDYSNMQQQLSSSCFRQYSHNENETSTNSYDNCYGNIVYNRLSRSFNELIMGIAMSGTRVDQWDNIEQCFIMTHRITQHTRYIMENQVHYLDFNLDSFTQLGMRVLFTLRQLLPLKLSNLHTQHNYTQTVKSAML